MDMTYPPLNEQAEGVCSGGDTVQLINTVHTVPEYTDLGGVFSYFRVGNAK